MGDPPRRALTQIGVHVLLLLALLAAWLPGAARAAPAKPVAVYGIEVDVFGEKERVLVFAEQPLQGRLEERDPETLLVVIPGAVLDPSAPARVAGAPGAGVRLVSAAEASGAGGPEVRLTISRTPGPPAELTQRGATLAVELARPHRPREGGIEMKFTQAPLAEIVDKVGRATGQSFLYDETLQGQVTLTSPERVSKEEALELLDTVLLMKGFAALPTPSGARKILPFGEGAPGAAWKPEMPAGASESPIVTLVHLRAIAPEAVTATLQPWVGASALAIPFAATNALILAGSEARLRTLMEMIAVIDQAADEELIVRRLRHRSAGEAADLLLSAFGEASRGRPAIEAWPDERTGALVLRAPPAQLDEARAFLEQIDRPAEGRGGIGVIPLAYADAKELSTLLMSFAKGEASRGTQPGVAGGESLTGRDFSVAVYAPTRSLLVRADPETRGIIEQLVEELDRPPVTISVELIVLQMIYDSSLDLGFDAFIPLSKPKTPDDMISSLLLNPSGGGLFQPGTGTGPAYAARFTRAPLVIPFVDGSGNPASLIVPRTSAVLTANDARVNTTELMRPQLRMLSGEEQEIFAGNNIPILVSKAASPTAGASGNPFMTSQNVERQDVGIRLRVKPTVGEAGGVRLELDVDVTSLAPPLAGDVEEVGPTIRQRRLTSTIHLDDREYVVVGFAREPMYEMTETGVPWFSKIPILGWAFRTNREQKMNARLVIAAGARLERTPDEQVADSIRERIAFERSNARFEQVPQGAETTWGLRVATLADEADARAVAARLATDVRPARITRWESSGGPAFDVTLVGFATLPEANARALGLREEGYDPEVVVLPVEGR